MDLGLDDDSSERPKVRAVGRGGAAVKGDVDKMMVVLARLSLSTSLRMRCMQSILLTVLQVPADNVYIEAGVSATQEWTARAQESTREQKVKLGQPHVHCFNAMLKQCEKRMRENKDEAKLKTLTDYSAECQQAAIPTKCVAESVRYWRVQKNCDKEFNRLEMNVIPQTSAAKVMQVIVDDVLSLPRTSELPGIAPAGDLERRVQAWLEAQKDEMRD